jgi:hypothetical protein
MENNIEIETSFFLEELYPHSSYTSLWVNTKSEYDNKNKEP